MKTEQSDRKGYLPEHDAMTASEHVPPGRENVETKIICTGNVAGRMPKRKTFYKKER